MKRTYPYLTLVAALTVTLSWAIPGAWSGKDPSPTNHPDPFSAPRLHWQGVASCSAAACHGGMRPEARAEYSIWADHDKHARAYQVLFDERSRRIIKNLGAEAPAHENRSCLSCHGMAVPPSLQGPRFQANDGIGCERCHGPAESWLTAHYTAAWRPKSDPEKE